MSAHFTLRPDEHVSSDVACAMLGISRRSLNTWGRCGLLPPPTRISHKVLFWDLAAIKKLMAGRQATGKGGAAHAR
jgi:hypothetical protein